MPQTILSHRFDNGLALVAEPMDWLESAAFSFLIPGGCTRDPAHLIGLANFTCEMVQRGCGDRDSRQFVEDLENLGANHGASVNSVNTSFGGAVPAENLFEVLAIHADMLLRPHLPDKQLEDGRQVCYQEIRGVEDDLAQRLIIELRRRQYSDPYGRSAYGTYESVGKIKSQHISQYFQDVYRPDETILAVAGKIDWQKLKDQVGSLLGDWPKQSLPPLKTAAAVRGRHHIQHDSNQTHIGIAFKSVPYGHPDYFQARGAVGVLSGGMSSRLFTEVREKRGLCYTVYASDHSLRDQACIVCYAGTTTERAQETLDVLIAELKRLADGIEEDELNRLKAQVRSALIMEQESSRSRSSSIAADWYFLERVRTLDELNKIINDLTVDSINNYLVKNPPGDFCIVTLGEKELETPSGVL